MIQHNECGSEVYSRHWTVGWRQSGDVFINEKCIDSRKCPEKEIFTRGLYSPMTEKWPFWLKILWHASLLCLPDLLREPHSAVLEEGFLAEIAEQIYHHVRIKCCSLIFKLISKFGQIISFIQQSQHSCHRRKRSSRAAFPDSVGKLPYPGCGEKIGWVQEWIDTADPQPAIPLWDSMIQTERRSLGTA